MTAHTLTVEVDMGSFSSLGRPPALAWLVRLRRADRSVVVAIGLSRIAADHLAAHIADLVHLDPSDSQGGAARPAQEVGPIA